MASMKYCDKHNQVGFLKKPEECTGFAEITATATTLADGTLELSATIDTLEYTITEASVQSKLQLADASGISMLPNNEIFEGMGNIGYPANVNTLMATVLTKKIFGNMKRGFRGVPRPLLPAMLPVVAVNQSAGQADQAETQPSLSEPLPSSSQLLVISPVAELTTHPKLLSPEPNIEPIEHPFEQPSPEHQPLSPRQKTKIP
ncbi:hypothetical protein Tco_0352161 [Tanacetum coccineum]